MKLIVGLGNPGKKYDYTRHNVGFMILDEIRLFLGDVSLKKKFNGLYFISNINDEEVIFLYPQKYMNLSGEVVRDFVSYFKVDLKNILIVHDDIDLSFGEYKLKYNSSSGGHNGIKNIELNLNSKEYKRLKIGIGPSVGSAENFVLKKFSKDEISLMEEKAMIFKDIVFDFINLDFLELMNKYN